MRFFGQQPLEKKKSKKLLIWVKTDEVMSISKFFNFCGDLYIFEYFRNNIPPYRTEINYSKVLSNPKIVEFYIKKGLFERNWTILQKFFF